MKINLKELNEQAISKTTGSKKMRLSENASSMVFQLFTKNVYSNPIGTVVREITSNCFDSHVEAKVNSPVIIRKTVDKETGTTYISFIDYGVGMSPDRIENIYGVYFESTKRCDNTQIGGFGIGGKTPLAYKRSTGLGEQEYDNSFNVITVFDNVKYYYLVYEGAECPEVSLLHSEVVNEHNGTEIRIPVLDKDVYKFEREMTRQLYYFENVIFEGFKDSYGNPTLKNDYQIIRGKNFLYRGNEYAEYMHICLGRVAYPIDYNVLNLSASDYRLPIALKLEVGEINVTVSREMIDYSELTIKMIKAKLLEAKKELCQMLAKQYTDVRTLEDYFNVKADFGNLNFKNGGSINLGNLIDKSDVKFTNFKYNNLIKIPSDKHLFSFFFDTKMYGDKPKTGFRRRRRRYSEDVSLKPKATVFEGDYKEIQTNSNNVLFAEGEFNRKIVRNAYLKSLYANFYIVEKKNILWANKGDIADLFSVALDKMVDDNGKMLPIVQTFAEMQDEYFEIVKKHCKNYDEVEVPESFVLTRKRSEITAEMRNTTIPVRLYNSYGSNSSYRIKLDAIFKMKEPIYFGTKDDEYVLQKAVKVYGVLFNEDWIVDRYSERKGEFEHDFKQRVMFIQISQGNLKYMEFCQNAKPISQIYHDLFHRKADVVKKFFQSYRLRDEYSNMNKLYVAKGFDRVNKTVHSKATEVRTYFESIKTNGKDLQRYIYDLDRWFDTKAGDLTAEQKRMSRIMEDLNKYQERNKKIMQYISMPWRMECLDEELINILSKVMVA